MNEDENRKNENKTKKSAFFPFFSICNAIHSLITVYLDLNPVKKQRKKKK